MSPVKNLLVDALNAYLYWSTKFGVYVARLNGEDRRTYFFCDKVVNLKISGFTIDLREQFIFWVVIKNNGQSELYRYPTIEKIPVGAKITPHLVIESIVVCYSQE